LSRRRRIVSTNLCKRQPKYKAVTEDLRNAILKGTFSPGDLLPSQHELVTHYGVALGTIRQAITCLHRDGYVQPEKGRGVVVKDPRRGGDFGRQDRLATVGFAMVRSYSPSDPVYQLILRGATEIVQAAGKHMLFALLPGSTEEGWMRHLERVLDRVSALLVVSGATPDIVRCIQRHGVTLASVGHPDYPDPVYQECNEVTLDGQMAGYLAAQALALHGHRQVGLIQQLDNLFNREIRQGFRRACREYGLQERLVCLEPNPPAEIEEARRVAEAKEATGLVVVGNQHTCRLIQDLSRLGVSVPADRSIVSIGSLPRSLLSVPALARVHSDPVEMGRVAARLLLARTSSVVHRSLPPAYEAGTTVKSLSPSSVP